MGKDGIYQLICILSVPGETRGGLGKQENSLIGETNCILRTASLGILMSSRALFTRGVGSYCVDRQRFGAAQGKMGKV